MSALPRLLARGAALFLALAAAPAAQAQDWATRALCTPPEVAIFDEVFAPEGRAELERRAARLPNGTGRFWRVTAPNGTVSHLWGSMHSSHPDVLDLPDTVRGALDSARRVALEIDPVFPDRASHESYMQGEAVYRPENSDFRFSNMDIPEKLTPHLRARLTALGWPDTALDDLNLGALTELLLFDPCEDFSAGILPSQDSFIQTLAHIARIPVMGLEPVDRLSNKLNAPESRDLARAVIATYAVYLMPGSTPEARATVLALYTQGRIALLMAWDEAQVTRLLGDEGASLYGRMSDYLVDARNADFVEAARDELRQGGLFIAVGNFHLPGEKGLVALLRDEGFEVTRIKLPGEAP